MAFNKIRQATHGAIPDFICEDVGQTNTMAIERILKQFLDDYDSNAGDEKSLER